MKYGYYESRRFADPYKDYDYDNDGFPGEFVYGDDMYLDDYCMDEIWKPIQGFEGMYWVSDKGRVYSHYKDNFLYGSPCGKMGHIRVDLYRNRIKYRTYMHRLVAEAFIPNPDNLPLVRHLDDNPSNNDAYNLRCGTTLDNMRDCIESGRFRYFTREDIEKANQVRRTPVVCINLKTGRRIIFVSQQEAARVLDISQSDISAVLHGKRKCAKYYYFKFVDDPTEIDISSYKYSKKNVPIVAIRIETGERFIYGNQTEAALDLSMSIASINNVLHGKTRQAKGYIFEYFENEDDYYE